MELYLARQAGLCYGLRRALRMLENHARRQGTSSLAILEPFSDSPTANELVRSLGIRGITTLEETPDGMTLALPLDGMDPRSEATLKDQGIPILSTSCPRQTRAKELAYKLAKEGYPILVLGDIDDQDAAGILDWAEYGWAEQLDGLGADRGRVFAGCVTQPGKDAFVQVDDDVAHVSLLSSPRTNLDELGSLAAQGVRRFSQVRTYNTTCHSVTSRRIDAERLGEICEVVIVMGRTDDRVARLLAESAEGRGAQTILVPSIEDLADLSEQSIATLGLIASWDVDQGRFLAMVEHLRTTYGAQMRSTLS